MVNKRKDLTVQAKDTYDPADYITVHQQFFDGLRGALRRAHGPSCACIYCGNANRAALETPAAKALAEKFTAELDAKLAAKQTSAVMVAEDPKTLARQAIEHLAKSPLAGREVKRFHDCNCVGSCKGPIFGSRCRSGELR